MMPNIIDVFLDMLPYKIRHFVDKKSQTKLKREVKNRIREGYEWKPQPKVFGIGLSKTGTTSLAHALECLGYNTCHWRRNETGRILGWPEFFYVDAATDISCSAHFESLYYTFKKSRFIYTIRDLKSWQRSITNHYKNVEDPSDLRKRATEEHFERWDFHNLIHTVQVRESLYAQYGSWEEAYRTFDRRVRQFFENKPGDRLLEMNIIGGDGWEPLCSFLDCDVPNRPFPYRNESSNT